MERANLYEIAPEHWMQRALDLARAAKESGEVPVGAVFVFDDGSFLGAYNQVIVKSDPTAHAEILALRAACRRAGNYRLSGGVLYCTIEPCVMCMAAAIHARVKKVVYGAPDPRWGGAGSLYSFNADARFNHKVHVLSGVCEAQCRRLIRDFFREKRRKT